MHKGRLEAFSDGVMAIIITIMVLEIKVQHGSEWDAILPLWPVFVSYTISFIYVGIYWANHHHTMQAVKSVNGQILWANLLLLFTLSLLPFTSGWMGENHFAQNPVILYLVNLLMCAIAYTVFTLALIRHHGPESSIAIAFGKDYKGKLSIVCIVIGIGLAYINPWLGFASSVLVSAMWFIPDQRMAKVVGADKISN